MSADAGVDHLLARITGLEGLVRRAVDRRRGLDPTPDDPFRGLYISDDQIDRLLSDPAPPASPDADFLQAEADADAHAAAGSDGLAGPLRLHALAAAFALDESDVRLLLVALAPDLDPRFERFYGYLNDDVTRRRATIGLALELSGGDPTDAADRSRVTRLADAGLMLVEEPDRPYLGRSLRVPDHVTAHLLGDDRLDPAIRGYCPPPLPAEPLALAPHIRLVYLREPVTGIARNRVTAAGPTVVLDAERIGADADIAVLARIAAREALILGAHLVVGPVETLAELDPAAIRAFADQACRVVLTGRGTWDPRWSRNVPLTLDVAEPGPAEQHAVWTAYLAGADVDAAAETVQFRLSPEQVGRAAQAGLLQAAHDGTAVTGEHLRAGARGQNAAGLDRLARRVQPAVGWPDLVLPAEHVRQLRELADRARNRQLVLGGWKMRPGGGRGRGVSGLFAGDSGTGKTLAAEVIAAELGLDLYVVNLATVVDKYVGETEKNLERIFTEAAGVNGVLLFDEADAVFGKRSEVRDAHDRYANVETAYLLQRMESFDGIVLLTTNLRANVDEAFTRRLDAVVDFPMPDDTHRLRLWDRCLGSALPRAGDLDLEFCAKAFELSGGSIRSIALTAAYLAASADRPVEMADLVRAVHQEYRKLGRLSGESEFGRYHELLRR
ncbi:MAG TPA: ATP-binding protein [Actinopolymorphaceae bacterium]